MTWVSGTVSLEIHIMTHNNEFRELLCYCDFFTMTRTGFPKKFFRLLQKPVHISDWDLKVICFCARTMSETNQKLKLTNASFGNCFFRQRALCISYVAFFECKRKLFFADEFQVDLIRFHVCRQWELKEYIWVKSA
jgi:hypothetical protein